MSIKTSRLVLSSGLLLAMLGFALSGTAQSQTGRVPSGVDSPVIRTPGDMPEIERYTYVARAKGEKSVTITMIPGHFPAGLDQMVDAYTILTAVPIASITTHNESFIYTWYNFRVTSVLSRASRVFCVTCEVLPGVPTKFAPLPTGNIVVRAVGGSAIIDGINITMHAEPQYQMNRPYLLLLRDRSTRTFNEVTFLGLDDTEVYEVDNQGQLTNVITNPSGVSKVSQDILALGNLKGLQDYLRTRKEQSKQP